MARYGDDWSSTHQASMYIGGKAKAGGDITLGDKIVNHPGGEMPREALQALMAMQGGGGYTKVSTKSTGEKGKKRQGDIDDAPQEELPQTLTLAQAKVARLKATYLAAAIEVRKDVIATASDPACLNSPMNPTNIQAVLSVFSRQLATTMSQPMTAEQRAKLTNDHKERLARVEKMRVAFVAFEQAYTAAHGGSPPPPGEYCIDLQEPPQGSPPKRHSPEGVRKGSGPPDPRATILRSHMTFVAKAGGLWGVTHDGRQRSWIVTHSRSGDVHMVSYGHHATIEGKLLYAPDPK